MTANVNQFLAEVLSLKNRLLDLDSYGPEVFVLIRDYYFPEGAASFQYMMNQTADKNHRVIVSLIYSILKFVLYKKLKITSDSL